MANETESRELSSIEAAAYRGDFRRAAVGIVQFLQSFTKARSDIQPIVRVTAEETDEFQVLTRMAAVAGAVMAAPRFDPGERMYQALCQGKREWTALFAASGFRGTAHLLALIAERSSEGAISIRGEAELRRFLGA